MAETPIDMGKIITSGATGQEIENNFTFSKMLTVSGPLIANNYINTRQINFKNDKNSILGSILLETDETLKAEVLKFAATNCHKFGSPVMFEGQIVCKSTLHTDGGISTDGKCQASYFNATSDRRAKENITPTSFSALSAVNSLPVYAFNYKTKPEETTIGLIAQEAAEYDLDNFNMVDNLTATGENNDFMQMKESKLVYVLWKAVQELSAEVESLKEQLASK
jgi:hypothetical protein